MARPPPEGIAHLDRTWRRLPTLWLPLGAMLCFLLFPFYWMVTTTFKPDAELYDFRHYNPLWVAHPTLEHVRRLFVETDYPSWWLNTMLVTVAATLLSVAMSVGAAYGVERLRFRGSAYVGLAIFLAYLVPPSILFIPLSTIIFRLGLFDTDWALIVAYPTFLVPFCSWLLMGYFRTIPFELEECALIDGASRLQILWRITLPLAVPGLISAGIFAFTRDTACHGFWRWVIHPRNNGYHLTHHLLPAVPYYRLPQAHALFQQLAIYRTRGQTCTTYFAGPNAVVSDWQAGARS